MAISQHEFKQMFIEMSNILSFYLSCNLANMNESNGLLQVVGNLNQSVQERNKSLQSANFNGLFQEQATSVNEQLDHLEARDLRFAIASRFTILASDDKSSKGTSHGSCTHIFTRST